MTTRTDSEAERMRRVPGIEFVDTPTGRMARPLGTGLRVWQIVRFLREFDWDRAEFHDTYDWLTHAQIDAALAYYKEYPEEVDARIKLEETPIEEVYEKHPFMRPSWIGRDRA